jgi:hypothetical protein
MRLTDAVPRTQLGLQLLDLGPLRPDDVLTEPHQWLVVGTIQALLRLMDSGLVVPDHHLHELDLELGTAKRGQALKVAMVPWLHLRCVGDAVPLSEPGLHRLHLLALGINDPLAQASEVFVAGFPEADLTHLDRHRMVVDHPLQEPDLELRRRRSQEGECSEEETQGEQQSRREEHS